MRSRPVVSAALADLACVLVFVAVGRVSHREDVTPAGVLATTWPFAAGWLLGWVLVLVVPAARTRPAGRLAGALVWVATVALGMVLRALSGAGVETSFVIVAAVVLGVFLLGWRGVVALARRSRRETRADAPV